MNEIEKEIWKDIPNYEGLYIVSNFGRVISLERFIYYKNYCKKLKQKLLKQDTDKHGYKHVVLSKQNITKRFQVHRLVAIAFIPNPQNKPHVNHIEGHKSDNRVSKLEWVTVKENEIHSYRVLGKKPIKTALGKFGKEHNRSIPLRQLTLNNLPIQDFECARDAERKTGINCSAIGMVARGYRKSAGGYKWEFKKNNL